MSLNKNSIIISFGSKDETNRSEAEIILKATIPEEEIRNETFSIELHEKNDSAVISLDAGNQNSLNIEFGAEAFRAMSLWFAKYFDI
jgi:hypothetical protein